MGSRGMMMTKNKEEAAEDEDYERRGERMVCKKEKQVPYFTSSDFNTQMASSTKWNKRLAQLQCA